MKDGFTVVCLMAAISACVSVQAAEWKPSKRIEVVVPNAPGGGNDRLVRLVLKIAQEQKLIEPVVNVIHKPGAGVVMGLTYLNQFAGDGHHIAIVSSTFLGDYVSGRSAISPTDITPIAQLFTEYWKNMLARVVESDDWKKMLERDLVTNEFLRSARMRDELKADYAELKTVMTQLGLVKQ